MTVGRVRTGQWDDSDSPVRPLVDSGASCHITGDKQLLFDFQQITDPNMGVVYPGGEFVRAAGSGNLKFWSNYAERVLTISRVLYIPGCNHTLISVTLLNRRGVNVVFASSGVELLYGKSVIAKGQLTKEQQHELVGMCLRPHQYGVNAITAVTRALSVQPGGVKPPEDENPATTREEQLSRDLAEAELWHRRFAHISFKTLYHLVHEVGRASGIKVDASVFRRLALARDKCETCEVAKQARQKMNEPGEKARDCLERIHFDLMGPFPEIGTGGKRYVLVGIDEATRYSIVRMLHEKSDAADSVKEVCEMMRGQAQHAHPGAWVRSVHTDRGGEFTSAELEAYFVEKGILHTLNTAYTPEQNGMAERLNRTLQEGMRALLMDAGLSNKLWVEAMWHANALRNVCFSYSLGGVPHIAFFGKVPEVGRLKVFGCEAFAHTPGELRNKFSATARRGTYLGIVPKTMANLVLLQDGRLIASRSATFNEGRPGPAAKPSAPAWRKSAGAEPRSEAQQQLQEPPVEEGGEEVIPLDAAGFPEEVIVDTRTGERWTGQGPLRPVKPSVTAPMSSQRQCESAGPGAADVAKNAASGEGSIAKSVEAATAQQGEQEANPPTPPPPPEQSENQGGQSEEPQASSEGTIDAPPFPGSQPVELRRSTRARREPDRLTPTVNAVAAGNSGKPSSAKSKPQTASPPLVSRAAEKSKPPPGNTAAGGAGKGNNAPPTSYGYAAVKESDVTIPKSYKEAMASPYAQQWRLACEEEMRAQWTNRTWTMERPPPGTRIIGVRWVFTVKSGADGIVQRFKARLVAQGCSQEQGVDYDQVYAPTGRGATLRILLAVAAMMDWEIDQLDVCTAFLNGDLDETIYVRSPEGFPLGQPGEACLLQKSLYGLKQSPRMWHRKLKEELATLGFHETTADPALFVGKGRDGSVSYLFVHVDDILVVSPTAEVSKKIKAAIAKKFKIRDIGPAGTFLGLEITRDRPKRALALTQTVYAKSLLERVGMDKAEPAPAPLPERCELRKREEGEPETPHAAAYRSTIGGLMWLATWTRPDLAHSVYMLARFMASPTEEHWKMAMQVMRYLRGTTFMGLRYQRNPNPLRVRGYADADWGMDRTDRRSTTGYVFGLYDAAVSWGSKLQPTVATSTMEAEYMAAAAATREALWLRKLEKDLSLGSEGPTVIYGDNQGAICLTENPVVSARSKHIDIQHHFVRERMERGEVKFEYCNTAYMVADVLTKQLSAAKFVQARRHLGVA